MSLLGIDIGTTGCKAVAFRTDGSVLASAYAEYDNQRPRPGWAELNSADVWGKIKQMVLRVTQATQSDPVVALSVSSLGEAVVPVSAGRKILGASILNFDIRGEEYLPGLRAQMDDERLYRINGNTLGNHYGLTKLLWIRDHQPELYAATDRFLLWSSFVSFMLGTDPAVDYSLANRTLLFDLDKGAWSDELLALAGLDQAKLPVAVPSGTVIGSVSRQSAEQLSLPVGALIVSCAHDQCASAVGCGVIEGGLAVYNLGTFVCITPAYQGRKEPGMMVARGLNTEHHAVPGLFASFIYNQGGSLVKWFRDTFASEEHRRAAEQGEDIYDRLMAEIPPEPGNVIVLPHFTTTGPPEFISASSGVIAGLKLETTRGDILKGILEGATFYLKECVEALPGVGIAIDEYRAVGGGSKSDAWLQLSADILGKPIKRSKVTEAGALGAAIIAGVGSGVFPSYDAGVQAMVKMGREFEPDPHRQLAYAVSFEKYSALWPSIKDYLLRLSSR